MAKKKNIKHQPSRLSEEGEYSTSEMPIPDGHPTFHRPRRNYWGNLYDEDTYQEDIIVEQDYDYSDFDSEDDHCFYYDSDSYD